MKKYIVPLICYLIILIVLLKIDTISNFIASRLTSAPKITIKQGNIYKKDYDFLYVKNSIDYIPYSYNDILDIFYSVINNGWDEFTFYCPKEYYDCVKDVSSISKDDLSLTHINNYVHPYNSFNTIKTSITETGEITINVEYLYNEEEINKINEYVDNLINNYGTSNDDYQKIKRLHDVIINNTSYDIKRNDTGDSEYTSYKAIGPVESGYATCNGYADLMAIILSKLNYQNYKIATTKEEISYESNGHVWNAVKIDNKWLHLDLTWDDPVSSDGTRYLHHKYFLVSTEEMQKADSGNVHVEEHNFNKAIYQEFIEVNEAQ